MKQDLMTLGKVGGILCQTLSHMLGQISTKSLNLGRHLVGNTVRARAPFHKKTSSESCQGCFSSKIYSYILYCIYFKRHAKWN